jgi:hypothetical protein
VRKVLVEKLIKGEATTSFKQVDRRRRSLRFEGRSFKLVVVWLIFVRNV